jgi:sulfoxide reductase heme-binding subunit YedZ
MSRPTRNLGWWAKHHFGKVRVASFVAFTCPALWLWGEWLTGSLGVNPLNRLLRFTGEWALIMLTITLAVTPLRRFSVWLSQVVHARYGKRMSDWNWMVRLRRQFGLFTFSYACLHLAFYAVLDAGGDLLAIRDDMLERPFILLGFAAFACLVPLAATSNQFAMRALGGIWRRLHMLSYGVAVLALVHFWLQVKVGETRPLADSIVLGLLLFARLHAWWTRERVPDDETVERPPVAGHRPVPSHPIAPGGAPTVNRS